MPERSGVLEACDCQYSVAGLFASAEGTDNPCSTAVMILLQIVELGAVPWAFIQFENGCKGRGTHDLAIGSYKLGFLFGMQGWFRLGRDPYCLRIPTRCEYRIAMNAAIWHHLLPYETPTLLMPLEGFARRSDQATGLLWRLQRVDGRRVDAFVADLLCSRLHCVAAPTVSNVVLLFSECA